MSDTLPHIRAYLEHAGHPFEVWPCDAELADTQVFCEHYGVAMENSVNAILVRSKTGELHYALCLLTALTRLDVNHTVRKKLGARKVSFASAEETRELTGMEIGGVTPIGLPDDLPVWIDARVMALDYMVLGGGNRSSKLKVEPALLRALPGVDVVEGLALPIKAD